MSLFYKYFNQLNEQDLLDWISIKVEENRLIEYKLILPGNTDHDKKEFLADVSSLANSHGGFTMYGMAENNGLLRQYSI